jgi:hypothetical protein
VVKADGAPMPCFSPPSQPFPATALAEGRQFNGAPFPASATAEGRLIKGGPSPWRGEGAKRPSRTSSAELQLPTPSHWLPLLQIVQIFNQPLVKSLRAGIHRIVRGILE